MRDYGIRLGLCAVLLCAAVAEAGISAQDAARLGADLTPLGADKAGNATTSALT